MHGPRGSGLLVHCRDSTGREAVGRHDDLLRCWGGGGGACWQEDGRQEVQEGKEMQGKRKGKRFAYLIIPRSLTDCLLQVRSVPVLTRWRPGSWRSTKVKRLSEFCLINDPSVQESSASSPSSAGWTTLATGVRPLLRPTSPLSHPT